jgi:hypothetical protein
MCLVSIIFVIVSEKFKSKIRAKFDKMPIFRRKNWMGDKKDVGRMEGLIPACVFLALWL